MLPDELQAFIAESRWTFARTMPEWPHEYIVRHPANAELFERLVAHIRAHGSESAFYQKVLIYLEDAGRLYWTLGAPIPETTIINRCRKEDSYAYRLRDGTLP